MDSKDHGSSGWSTNEVFDKMPQAWGKGLSSSEYHVLGAVAHHRNNRSGLAFPSWQRLAALTGLSRSTVSRALRRLEELGLIEVERRTGRSSLYRLMYTHTRGLAETEAEEQMNGGNVTSESPPHVTSGTRNKMNIDKTKYLKGRELEEFLEWWDSYPKRVAKGEAEQAWMGTERIRPPLDELILRTRKWVRAHAGRDRKYLPNPAKWLRGRRWEDELAEVEGTPNPYRRL